MAEHDEPDRAQAILVPGFPWRLLVHLPLLVMAVAATLRCFLYLGIYVDLIANALALPLLIAMAATALTQLCALPLALYRMSKASVWRQPGVWLALGCGLSYLLLFLYIAIGALYAVT